MPFDGIASAGFFAESAHTLVRRLAGENTDEAKELAEGAARLAVLFEEWRRRRPPDDERIATIRELFEYNRRTLDYFATRGIPTTTRPGPRVSGTSEVDKGRPPRR